MSAVIGSLDLTLPAVDTATKPLPVMDAAAALATLHSKCHQNLRLGLRLTLEMPCESKSLDTELMDLIATPGFICRYPESQCSVRVRVQCTKNLALEESRPGSGMTTVRGTP